MSQKSFTSHGHPIPGAPYWPDQQPRNVARCGGPGLCPECSREAGHGNNKNQTDTIDHQQAARTAVMNSVRQIEPNLYQNPHNPERYYGGLADDILTAATPHLRAEWEQPIRELCEGALAKADDPLASRMFNGSPFPAVVRAKDVLALLEGGAE